MMGGLYALSGISVVVTPAFCECEINYQGRASISMLVDFLPTLSDIEFRAGKASKDPEKRKASAWLFNPQQPVSDLGKLNLVDLETGESVSFRALLQGNGKLLGMR